MPKRTAISRNMAGVRTIIVVSLTLLPSRGEACSMLPMGGYFHQVTNIRGRVVGKSLGLLQFRWLRQSFAVSDATLTLYEYSSLAKSQELKQVAVVKTNSNGAFDFGAVPIGHYSLSISASNSDRLSGWFDVEVTDKVRPTEMILLDVSPIRPDCTGGHEFIEKKAINAQTH